MSGFLVMIGGIGLSAEQGYEPVLQTLDLLGTLLGRGIFYSFAGVAALGIAGDLGMFVGIISMVVGLSTWYRLCFCNSDGNWETLALQQMQKDNAYAAQTPYIAPGPAAAAGPAGVASPQPIIEDRSKEKPKQRAITRMFSGRFTADLYRRRSNRMSAGYGNNAPAVMPEQPSWDPSSWGQQGKSPRKPPTSSSSRKKSSQSKRSQNGGSPRKAPPRQRH